jgi:MFS family permease
LIIQGLVVGAIPTSTFAAASEIMGKPQWAGLGLAVVLVGQNVGQLIGPVLFGELVQGLGWAAAGYLMIPFCLLGFVSGWMVKIR